jgi:hypothetical protein
VERLGPDIVMLASCAEVVERPFAGNVFAARRANEDGADVEIERAAREGHGARRLGIDRELRAELRAVSPTRYAATWREGADGFGIRRDAHCADSWNTPRRIHVAPRRIANCRKIVASPTPDGAVRLASAHVAVIQRNLGDVGDAEIAYSFP